MNQAPTGSIHKTFVLNIATSYHGNGDAYSPRIFVDRHVFFC